TVPSLALQINTTTAPVTLTDPASGNPVTIQPGLLLIQGTGIDLTLLGQTLHGDFTFQQITPPANPNSPVAPAKVVLIAANNLSLTFTAGTTTVASLANGSGFFVVTSAGVAGRLGGTISFPSLSLSGNFAVAVNTTSAAVNQSLQVGGQT